MVAEAVIATAWGHLLPRATSTATRSMALYPPHQEIPTTWTGTTTGWHASRRRSRADLAQHHLATQGLLRSVGYIVLFGGGSDRNARTTRAGLPTTRLFGGTSFVTTAPAPMMAFSPTITPARTIAPPPSHALSSIVIGLAASYFARRSLASVGCVGVRSWTFGPF